jgi:hypothetical protein
MKKETKYPGAAAGRKADDGGERQMKPVHDAIGDERHLRREKKRKEHPSGTADPHDVADAAPKAKRRAASCSRAVRIVATVAGAKMTATTAGQP